MIATVDLDGRPAAASLAIADALCDMGAFYLRGHQVDDGVLAGAYDASRRLRSLDDEEKQPFEVGSNGLARGWHRVMTSGRRSYETYEVGLEVERESPSSLTGGLHGPNLWPTLAGFRDEAYRFFEAMLDLGQRLLGPVAAGVGLDPTYLADRAEQPVSLLRMINYEARAAEDDQVRIVPHTDFELFTIISESSPGFELCDRTGRWHRASTADPSEFLVLAGDILEIVTAGRVESPLHRVRAGSRPRQSMVFFFGLDAEAVVSPQLPAVPGREGAYAPTVVGHHLARQILSCPRLRAQHDAGELFPGLALRGGNPYKAHKMDRLVDEHVGAG